MEVQTNITTAIDNCIAQIFSHNAAQFESGLRCLGDLFNNPNFDQNDNAYIRNTLNDHGGFNYIDSMIESTGRSQLQGLRDDIYINLYGEFQAGCDILFGPALKLASKIASVFEF